MIGLKQKQIRLVAGYKIIVVLIFLLLSILAGILSKNPIYIYANSVSENSSEQNADSVVTDLDLGDYISVMTVGEKQLLSITLLPQNVTLETVTYHSANVSVATINSMGRITAVAVGKTQISVSYKDIKRVFDLTVQEVEPTKAPVHVTDIEVADYKEELEVDKTLSLSATILPSDATNSKLTYASSNSAIATVNYTGVVKGIAPGDVEITLSADGFSKSIPVHVKIATTSIELNTNYLILKKGDTFQLKGKVQPSKAYQILTYKSSDDNIAVVTGKGKVTAKKIGTATILVSNEDMINAVTVIVNAIDDSKMSITSGNKVRATDITEQEAKFLNTLSEKNEVEINAREYSKITRVMLKALYDEKKTALIRANGYTITLSGQDIVNFDNELINNLTITKTKKGIEIILNDNKELPGGVLLSIKNVEQYNYLYLYNVTNKKYEKISVENLSNLQLDTAGKYLITEKKIDGISFRIVIVMIIIFSIVVVGLTGTYIAVKKKYWFW